MFLKSSVEANIVEGFYSKTSETIQNSKFIKNAKIMT